MLKTLIKKQLSEHFSNYIIDRKTGKARSKKGMILYFALMIFVFGGVGVSFYNVGLNLGRNMVLYGYSWLYFALMGLFSIALGVFGSVFNTFASLYLPKDNEFLLSLPIPSRTLVLARAAGVYLISLLYSAWVWIPATIAYWRLALISPLNVIFPVLLTFVIALLVTVLSCALGWLVALITTKAKSKTVFTVLLSLLFMGGYYFVYFKVVNALNDIANHLDSIGNMMKTKIYYIYLLGSAADGNILSMVVFTGITVLLSVICLLVLARTFNKFALTAEKSEKTVKKAVGYESRSLSKTLLNREFKHFTSTSSWLLNGGFGIIVLIGTGIAALIKGGKINEMLSVYSSQMPMINEALPVFIVVAVCLVAGMNTTLCCSVSLEGKTLWMLQSLPVDPRKILEAKEQMGFLLNVFPALFAAVIISVVLKVEVIQIDLIIVAVILYIWLQQDFGLILNLKRPDFNWTNPTTVVKQSVPAFANIFGGYVIDLAFGAAGWAVCKFAGIYAALIAIIVIAGAACLILHNWIKTKGAKIISEL